MNIAAAIRKHEDMAVFYARQGLARRSRAELLRAEQLKVTRRIKRECKLYRDLDDSVNGGCNDR